MKVQSKFTRLIALAGALSFGLLTSTPANVLAASDDEASARKLYLQIGQIVGQQFVEVDRLKNWSEVWNRHGNDIHSNDDAIKFASEGVATLKDKFTRILHGMEAKEITDQFSGHTATTGMKYLIVVNDKGEAVKDDKGEFELNRNKDGHPCVGMVMANSPAQEAGMKAGDVLETVNGKDTAGISLEELAETTNGKAGTAVSITYSRGGEKLEAKMVTKEVEIPNVTSVMLPKKVGYIRLRTFLAEDTGDKYRRACEDLADSKGLILDLRHNGGGRVDSALAVASESLDSGTLVSFKERVEGRATTQTQIDFLNPAGFLIEEMRMGHEKQPYLTRIKVRLPNVTRNVPMIVLVDEGTASGSEIVAAALQQNGRAKIVGTRTYGKGCAQNVNKLLGGSVLVLDTISKWYMPDGKCLSDAPANKHGIKPDVECAESDPDQVEKEDQNVGVDVDKDEQLKKAYEMLAGE